MSPDGAGRRLARSAGIISAATMLSRLLGLVREQLFAALMGATMVADAFVVGFRIPNLLRDLFAEGALAQAFVPTFKRRLKDGGVESAYQLANRVAGSLAVLISVIILIAALFAPSIVSAIAPGFADTAGKSELTVDLTRLMLPFLLLVSMSAVAMGMLNAQDHYAAPALAPAAFNLASIAGGLILYWLGVDARTVVIGWSIGTLAGGASQLLIQLPSLWRRGYRPRLRLDLALRDPDVKRVALLMLPAIGGLAAMQINVFVNTMFAAEQEGAQAWLNYAFRFLQLPIGVFGVAIATVSTTRYADAAADNNRPELGAQFERGLRLVMFLCVPATVGLVLLGQPIIGLIYQRGMFGASDTAATAAALDFYSLGLVAYAAVKVAAPAYYAIGRPRIPMLASISAVAGNLALNLTLHPIYGYRILALGTAVAATLNFAILYLMFSKHVGALRHRVLMGHLLRTVVAAAIMGAVVLASHEGLSWLVSSRSLAGRAMLALGPVLIGAVVYGAVCWMLKVEEVGHYVRRLRRH